MFHFNEGINDNILDCTVVTKEPELVYHRLDLVPHSKMCIHLKQLSTPGKS